MTIALHGLRGRLLMLTVAAAGFLSVPALAEAAYVTRDDNTLMIVEDAPGPGGIPGDDVEQTNTITVTFDAATDEYVVRDTGGSNPTTDTLAFPIENRCTGAGDTVRCPAEGVTEIDVDAGQLVDIVDLDDPTMPDTLTSVVSGGTGRDELRGLDGGADQLNGQDDGDDLYGNGGNDVLSGAGGEDILRGGEGNDTLRGGALADDFHGEGGEDTVDYSADGTSGVGAVVDPNTPSGFGCLDTPGACEGDQINTTVENLRGTGGDDHLIGSENVGNKLFGLGGADRLFGLSGGDQLDGDAGNDQLFGALGADTLNGGTGNDRLRGGFDNDVMNGGGDAGDLVDYADRVGVDIDHVTVDLGVATPTNGGAKDGSAGSRDTITGVNHVDSGAGDDVLTGNDNANTFNSGDGRDALTGKGGNDTFNSGAGDDTINGGPGDDTFNAGDGNDAMTGDAGNDTFNAGDGDDLMNGGAGADTYSGGAGERDHVTYADDPNDADDAAGGVTVTIGTGVGDDGSTNDGAVGSRDTVGADVEDVTGGPDDDEITGSANDNILHGGGGNDTLTGLGGPDFLYGDADSDTVSYDERTARVDVDLDGIADDGNALDGTPEAPAARDLVDSTIESIIGGSGPDVLTGNSGANTFTGGAGEDSVIYFNDGRPAGAGVIVSLDGSANDGTGGAEGDNVGADVENLVGTDSDDTLAGDGDANKLFGRGGTDTLSGQGAGDVLDGGAGAGDQLDGGSQDDLLHPGGEGTLSDGADSVNGSVGNDTVTYASVFAAGSQHPLVAFASQGRSAPVRVTLAGGADDGQIAPASEGDSVTGVENATGGAGNDELTGSTSANTLDGHGGDDRLNPGVEPPIQVSDTLIGGDGAHDLADYSGRGDDDLVITLDDTANDGEDGENDEIDGTVEDVTTAAGDDDVTGSPSSANTIRTAAGADTVNTSDTTADSVDCGDGVDTATVDHRDAVEHCESTTFTSKAKLSVADAQVTEGTGGTTSLQFKVTVDAAPGSPVTFHYATSEGTATEPEDYTHTAGTAGTIPAGQSETTISVPVNPDSIDEDDETLTLTISNPSSNGEIADGSAAGTIVDDEGIPTVSVGDAQIPEGDSGPKTLNVPVTLSGPSEQDVTVKYSTGGGNATAGSDYTAVDAQTVTIPAGQTSASAPVTIAGDTVDEANETFVVTLSEPTNAVLGDATGTATITDDDGEPSLSIADASVTEGNAGTRTVTFTVTLSQASGQAVTVDYATSDATATVAGDDYESAAGELTFQPGDTSKTVDVTTNGDTAAEDDETFTVTLTGPTNSTISDPTATGTITDDDQPGVSVGDATVSEGGGNMTFTVTLSQASGKSVTVDYATAEGSAVEPEDFTQTGGTLTFAPGETSKPVEVPVQDDSLDEPDETLALQLTAPTNATLDDASATGTITDDDPEPSLTVADAAASEGAAGVTFTVSMSAVSSRAVTVEYATSDGSATAGSDYTTAGGTLEIPAGATSGQIQVPVVADAVDEPDETFTLTLSEPDNAAIGDGEATGTITDDEATPALSVAAGEVTEGNDGSRDLIFAVTLSGASSSDVTVKYSTSDGTATAGSDYTATAGTLTIEAGDTGGEVGVPVTGDTAVEEDEAFTLTLSEPAGATIAADHAPGAIRNDDAPVTDPPVTDPPVTDPPVVNPPVVPAISVNDGTFVEGDTGTAPAVFTVGLSAPTTATVTVKYVTSDGTATSGRDYAVTAGTLTFAPGERTKPVPVPVIGDRSEEPDETFSLVLVEPQNATLAKGTGTALIRDDETPRVAPRGVSARTTPSRDRSLPYRFRTDGRITLPSGVRRSDACAGKVQVRYKAGRKTISTRRANVRRDCTFTRRVSFGIRSRLRPGRLKVEVRFLGNAVLLPKSAKRQYVRVAR